MNKETPIHARIRVTELDFLKSYPDYSAYLKEELGGGASNGPFSLTVTRNVRASVLRELPCPNVRQPPSAMIVPGTSELLYKKDCSTLERLTGSYSGREEVASIIPI